MTANQISRDAYTAITLRMQGDMIAARDRAAINAAPSIADVLHNWTFEPCAAGTFFAADGTIKTRAVRISSPFNAADVFTVTQDAATGKYEAECPPFRMHWSFRMIEAMRAKVAADKAARGN